MPSSAGASERLTIIDDPLNAASLALVEQHLLGVVWLDAQQRIVSHAGVVPRALQRGARITDALEHLIGLEDEIERMRTQTDGRPIRIPNTSLMDADGVASAPLSLTLYWIENRRHYLIVFGALLTNASSTTELDQEIRRRQKYEKDLADKTAEYEIVNQQLEQFAYVLSHDLNAPLRALRFLCKDIDAAMPDGSPPDIAAVKRATDTIAAETRRMSTMMTDLLDYARVGRVVEAVATVDTHALVVDILASLRPTTTLALAITGVWPTIDTVAVPLDLVLRNLIENAIKHHDRGDGRVEVGAEPRETEIVFSVTDDGRGIPAEWQAAVFEPFRKIDDAHHPESSGIGLALVKRTITSLGGYVEVRSDAPQRRGTTFRVHWPRALPALANVKN